jgi:outer membrane protein insertion porin family
VNEGERYMLSGITFKNNKAITDMKVCAVYSQLKTATSLAVTKIAAGLENLRIAYGELGYINFTSVPDTTADDENKAVSLEMDLDEGKQFYVTSVNVLGLDEAARQELLKSFPIKRGQVYSSRLWEMSLLKYSSMFPDCPCRWYEPRHLDEHSGTVGVTLDFRPCSD